MPQTPAPQQPTQPMMPPTGERSMAQKMLWPLVSLVIVAGVAIGFAFWWNSRAVEESVVISADPREAVIQGMSKVIAAKDGEFSLLFPLDSFGAVDDVPVEPLTVTEGGKVIVVPPEESYADQYKNMVITMSGAWAQTGATSTQGRFDFDLTSDTLKVAMMMRAFNSDELYLQLAKLDIPEMPIDLTAIKGVWININVRQMLNDFGAGLGAAAQSNPELLKLVQEQPTRFIVSDRAVYATLFGDVMRRHDLIAFSLVSEGKYRLEEKGEVTDAQSDAFATDMVKTFVQQYFRDIDAALARTKKAGDTEGTKQLESYRKELVTEAGEDGSKIVEQILSAGTEPEDVPATASKEEGEILITLNSKTGALERVTVQAVTSASGKDLRSTKPLEMTFSKLNSGLRIERPTPSKSVYEMIPVFMGLLAGAGSEMEVKE